MDKFTKEFTENDKLLLGMYEGRENGKQEKSKGDQEG